MSKPYKISASNATVTVSSILTDSVPSIRVVYLTTGAGGMKRPISRQIPVPDPSLFTQVQRELHEGDKIEITAINEWYEDGYTTRLTSFKKVIVIDLEHTARNKTVDVAQSSLTENIVPSVRNLKATRH